MDRPAIARGEFEQRVARIQDDLARRRLDALLVYGDEYRKVMQAVRSTRPDVVFTHLAGETTWRTGRWHRWPPKQSGRRVDNARWISVNRGR